MVRVLFPWPAIETSPHRALGAERGSGEAATMNDREKQAILHRISREDRFRDPVLMTLLRKMGLTPTLTHGGNERGKDIVCKDENLFDFPEWIAIVAKVGPITGATSGTRSLQTVLNQVTECFTYAYKDPQTKASCPINKVVVCTNDEIKGQAPDKLVDKLALPDPARANVYFIPGDRLQILIDKHWPEFWSESGALLTDEDRMTETAALVLYVLASAFQFANAGGKGSKKPHLSPEEIQRKTNLSKTRVEDAVRYLLQAQYLELGKAKRVALHPKFTVGKLLMDPNRIRLLLALAEEVNSSQHFTVADVRRVGAKSSLGFTKRFVDETIPLLERGDYIRPDTARGKGHYSMNSHTLQEERPYLQHWLTYQGATPTQDHGEVQA